MAQEPDVETILEQVIMLGSEPTQREMELAEAVSAHITGRDQAPGEPHICPTCNGTGRILPGQPTVIPREFQP